MDWKPITRGKPEILGVNARYPGLLDVRVRLSSNPPPEWARLFKAPSGHVTVPGRTLNLSAATISVSLSDDELGSHVAAIDERLRLANEEFARDVLPKIQAREEQKKREEEEKAARLAAARKKAQDL